MQTPETHILNLRVQHPMPASSALRWLAYPTSALELHLPAADGAVGHAGLLFDGFLIATSLEKYFDAFALVLIVGTAHDGQGDLGYIEAMTR